MGSKLKRAKCPANTGWCPVLRKIRNRAFFVWFVCDISSPCAKCAVISRRDVWKVFSLDGWSCRLALTWPWVRSLQLPFGDSTAIFCSIFARHWLLLADLTKQLLKKSKLKLWASVELATFNSDLLSYVITTQNERNLEKIQGFAIVLLGRVFCSKIVLWYDPCVARNKNNELLIDPRFLRHSHTVSFVGTETLWTAVLQWEFKMAYIAQTRNYYWEISFWQ